MSKTKYYLISAISFIVPIFLGYLIGSWIMSPYNDKKNKKEIVIERSTNTFDNFNLNGLTIPQQVTVIMEVAGDNDQFKEEFAMWFKSLSSGDQEEARKCAKKLHGDEKTLFKLLIEYADEAMESENAVEKAPESDNLDVTVNRDGDGYLVYAKMTDGTSGVRFVLESSAGSMESSDGFFFNVPQSYNDGSCKVFAKKSGEVIASRSVSF